MKIVIKTIDKTILYVFILYTGIFALGGPRGRVVMVADFSALIS